MKLSALLILLFTNLFIDFPLFSQNTHSMNEVVLASGYKLQGRYNDYDAFETERFLFAKCKYYSPGPIISIYTRIRKSDMKVMNTFESKQSEPVVFNDTRLYTFKMVKDKAQISESKSRWKIEVNMFDEYNKLLKTGYLEVPKEFDYGYKPSCWVTSSKDGNKLLVRVENGHIWVLDQELNTQFSTSLEKGFVSCYFIDNAGSAYVLRGDSKLLIFDANDEFTESQQKVNIPSGVISEGFKWDEKTFQIYTSGRIDFFLTYDDQLITGTVTTTYNIGLHFAIDPTTKDLLRSGSTSNPLSLIEDVFQELPVNNYPLIYNNPGHCLIAKFASGNVLRAQQTEFAYEKLTRINSDKSRRLDITLVNASGENLFSNSYSIVTRGTPLQHGFGIDVNASAVMILFNIDESDRENYMSYTGQSSNFKVEKVADTPSKMLTVMDKFTVNNGSRLYHGVLQDSQNLNNVDVTPTSFYVSQYEDGTFFLGVSDEPKLYHFADNLKSD